ncbi:hypothetical protein BD289DRAFT_79026 [Coniella lustricola]|uniref:Uncharacterized protein n=1 Tax=Coniella lustricola TaxID=2025994 RepID=A0A2T2ZZ53_9PEZI|nr:hypothetical protein BD289DRAFT_79026 [Coniella lustricola]
MRSCWWYQKKLATQLVYMCFSLGDIAAAVVCDLYFTRPQTSPGTQLGGHALGRGQVARCTQPCISLRLGPSHAPVQLTKGRNDDSLAISAVDCLCCQPTLGCAAMDQVR